MCGIVGYVGEREASPLLMEGLKRLEYRGYDSAGVAVENGAGLQIRKKAGKLDGLTRLLQDRPVEGTMGIAHTRWATHGAPTTDNAHPHHDCTGTIALVHNGIIENEDVLRTKLQELGHEFESETDTEVLVHLIEEAYEDNLEHAVAAALTQVEGTYALVVVSERDPGKIVAVRQGAPLLVGVPDGDRDERFVASDVAAILGHTRKVIYLEDGELAILDREGYETLEMSGWGNGGAPQPIEKEISHVTWDLEQIERGGFDHFMLKEICEQPDTIRDAMRGRLLEEEGTARLGGLNEIWDDLKDADRMVITACGTSWHAALIGEYMLEEHARMPVEVEYASEFRYRSPVVDEDTAVIAISQSGETADTLAAMREAKRRGATAIGIVNVVGSTIARETDGGVYTHSGPEIGVASTKAFTGQLTVLALITLKLARERGMSILEGREVVSALQELPAQVQRVLDAEREDSSLDEIVEAYSEQPNFLYLGRGYNFPIALEGALKLKEISYLHAEGYPAAEMKHGPIALIEEGMPAVFVAPTDSVYQKIVSNIQEVKARGGRVVAITTEDSQTPPAEVDHIIRVPRTLEMLQPILTVVPLQLMAYRIAVRRGCDVDQPRNLAKSVTVE
ncbi:MAG: glutamine--fructose-6-phosphate transaminase (isomerizing) [Candidatus Palauibacterales bacterium]|nr:glutamine--fructose-6-phosphate transaminase (isomerizing) [Candidatus Palauibacterales bacterium]